ncbi:chloroplast ATP synthase subunit delta precursor [Coccomyxa subellipsoidea C-169]|uniref:Chloroplast ATP synthase subunit delta n=1 Tax=Coccomyxa subellipsoidea (strain C-169) TaxID=574566 RepID=I0YMJ0_COCSC|nr:chloroplast ATP synthase subunit delta precursor [Coccomyxa subellipsoidea C-169]EIE19609.1 chloroplast ATP synthase subunit delta precursor [Coccomyxa subellipsoidea C-169]|eukprot:XP_005644153.1 chloroplast ATP synthase subunit delta precursor [Coccomyxa subellipsoidea C-169]
MATAFACSETMAARTCRPTSALQQFAGRPKVLLASRPQLRRQNARQVTRMAGDVDKVAAVYANALVDLAQGKNALDTVHADVDSLQSAFKETPDVKDFLFNPVVADKRKRELLSSLANDAGLSKHTLNFLNLLLDQDRLVAIQEIFDQFEIQYCKLTDTQVATLRSAVRLEQEQQFLIAKKLQELTGSKNIKLKPVIDESLIAGFIVEYGSSQIDLSVKGQLDKITLELTNGPALATA